VPQKVYDEPANLFVASFIGSPAMNLLEGEIVERDGVLACVIGDQELRLDEEVEAGRPALRGYAGRRVAVGIRPEDLGEAAARNGSPLQRLRGTVLLTEALGPEVLAHVEVAARPVLREEVLEAAVALDAAAVAGLESEARQRRTTIVGRFDSRTRVARDDEIELGVDPSSIHFFDLETGEAVTTMGDRLAVTVS
jgi:multiple sugar transport system ATP-binding protein